MNSKKLYLKNLESMKIKIEALLEMDKYYKYKPDVEKEGVWRTPPPNFIDDIEYWFRKNIGLAKDKAKKIEDKIIKTASNIKNKIEGAGEETGKVINKITKPYVKKIVRKIEINLVEQQKAALRNIPEDQISEDLERKGHPIQALITKAMAKLKHLQAEIIISYNFEFHKFWKYVMLVSLIVLLLMANLVYTITTDSSLLDRVFAFIKDSYEETLKDVSSQKNFMSSLMTFLVSPIKILAKGLESLEDYAPLFAIISLLMIGIGSLLLIQREKLQDIIDKEKASKKST